MTRLEEIYPEISRELRAYKAVETIRLSEDQMLVSKNLTPNPAPQGFPSRAIRSSAETGRP